MVTRDPSFDNDYYTEDGYVTWQHALDYVKKINTENYLSHNDWRLPNWEELRSLCDALLIGHPFENVQSYSCYWSSSTVPGDTNRALLLNIMYRWWNYYDKGDARAYVWLVRAGQTGVGPSVFSVNPNSGEPGKTLNVTITGANFTEATEVSFGSEITVNSFTVDSNTQITANITIKSSAASGARDVSVKNADATGKSLSGFGVKRPCGNKKPVILELFYATKGYPEEVVMIEGKNFCDYEGQVLFGKNEAGVISDWSNTRIITAKPKMTAGKKRKVLVKVKSLNGKISKTKPVKVLKEDSDQWRVFSE